MSGVLANYPASAGSLLRSLPSHEAGREISVFDLDRTLTKRPTYSLFLLTAAFHYAPWRLALIPLLLVPAIPYLLKLLPRKRMKELMHRVMLGSSIRKVAVQRLARRFAKDVAEHGVYPEAVEEIRREAAAGRRIVLATAAPAFYARPLARELGVTEVVATDGTWQDGCLTPAIAGENCHGAEKRRRLERLLRRLGIARKDAHIRFFSDDISDLPSFEWCDEAIAVNPCAPLGALARARKWRVLDWRHQRHMPA